MTGPGIVRWLDADELAEVLVLGQHAALCEDGKLRFARGFGPELDAL